MRRLIAAAVLAAPNVMAAQAAPGRTYANPLDLDYKYNFEQLNQGISYRQGADPVIVPHRGAYYLFVTVSGGYWRSTDLVRWSFVTPSRWPFLDVVAPAAISTGDTLLLLPSATMPQPILYSTRPETGRLEFYNRLLPPLPYAVQQGSERAGQLVHPDSVQPGPWDPTLFRDDDGRWYLYWGSSNAYPLYGLELDPARRLAYKHEHPTHLLRLHPDAHGWERFGRDHRDTTITPFVEGAWMTKHGGRYYLQYSAPGTEYNVYANGTYVGDAPLGPFTYAPYNPISYKPGGFVTGAGHGNTFADAHGNWWNTGTSWVGVNWPFERRVVMFPAGFDRDGQLHVDTRFGDFPHRAPTSRWDDTRSTFTGWMLLSYRRPAVASTTRDTFPARNVTDEDPRTFWVSAANRAGETLTVDLGAPRTVRAAQVNYTDWRSDRFASDSSVYTTFRLQTSTDGTTWRTVADLTRERRDHANAYVELAAPARARYVRYVHGHVGAANLAISDLRVFGTGDGARPGTPDGLTVRRHADARDATITWSPVPGAVGYNVLWGIAPDKLYQTYQLWADRGTSLELRALTAGQGYWFAIEAFDENGVSGQSRVVTAAP
ncbi:glycoside hydrolase family 43 (plasmid) [Gemmatirosa kalamazoonensis]|uniref:Glycoside hydrolase family 43 n=1 Tax=Gemmatirosa kalamazoonensis TaxID=861299 RepID=W0RSB3_9BACT|nr:family 43 glycosylhydrolase [Gemmatirosa kalamazoonensis]AHG93874.1 glycoside hydrolase family 43 [Gemmatirosa kalamazoonensis]